TAHEEVQVVGVVTAIDFAGVVGSADRQRRPGVITAIVESAGVVTDQGNVPHASLAGAHRGAEVGEVPIGRIAINGDSSCCGLDGEGMNRSESRADWPDVGFAVVIPGDIDAAARSAGHLAIPAPLL